MRFKINKVFVVYLLAALISAQFALLQHSTLHLNSSNHSAQKHSDDDEHESDICQTCVSAKNLAQKFLPQSVYSFSIQKINYQIASYCKFDNLQFLNKPFRSQAPPLLFS